MAINIQLADELAFELRRQWQERLAVLEKETVRLRESISVLDRQLEGKTPPVAQPAGVPATIPAAVPSESPVLGEADRKRFKRNEVRRVVAEFLAKHPEKGFTAMQISEQIGIGYSTCYEALKRNRDIFNKDNYLWSVRGG